jgi:NADPH-dependent glutamate synthase beta subunit-like oxidoreductase/2,4-dienoyl-CoA reductase-like NADH-dependent reductase (Old Yellow Enzyme family)
MSAHETFHFHSLDQLRGRIAELGLDLEASEDLKPLFQPLQIGNFTLPNRLVVLPMEGDDGLADGSPDELTFRRYRRFAAGGAGLLWVEATAVVEEGRANPRQLWLRQENLDAFARLGGEARRAAHESCGHRPFLVVQLTHSGRYSKPGRKPAPIIAHRSPYLDPLQQLPPDYPVISDDELERLEERYVEAARCAWRAGFDAVDVKACHRYLVSELLASHTRQGRYGGSFENRSRFFRNVVRRIREEVPQIAVTSRMNAYDAMAYPYGFGVDPGDPAKPALEEPIELVRFLRDSGAVLVNITIGNPYYNPHVNRPFDLPTAGSPIPAESPLEGVARFTAVVREIQAAVPEVAVIGGGYSWLRQFFPHVAAANLRKGWVRLVGVGRMAFAYPSFARDLAEHGRLDGEKVCVACSACTQIMRDGGRTGCVPRDAAIYEPIYKAGRAEALDTIKALAATCRQCNDPTCVGRCPAQVNIPEFVGHIAAGRFREAYETLRQANVLAAVCGYVCPAETLCESACISEHYTQPVPIRHLQRWVSRKAVEEGWAAGSESPKSSPRRVQTPQPVAVLGAGAAGVAAAAKLAALGYSVTLFHAGQEMGGVAGETIPAARLPADILSREIRDVLASSGAVAERAGVRIGPGRTLDSILAEGFQAAVVALGLNRSVALPGAARAATGVVGALDFLRQVKKGAQVSAAVVVLGGGNTAIDAALAAKRAGAESVAIVYRRSFAEMPAWPEERDAAIREGIHFLILTQPLDYVVDEHGRLAGLKVVRTRLVKVEGSRAKPEPLPGSEHLLPANIVVEAIGQQADEELRQALQGVRFTENGLIETRPGSLATSRPGVWAAGDIVNGGTTVVQAVAEGTRAAIELDAWLRSKAPGAAPAGK